MKKFLNFTVNELLKQQSFTRSRNILDFKTQRIRFFCSISSGQDSTVTLFLLFHKDKKESLQLLYCNHFWQIKNFFSARSLYHVSYFSNVPYTFILTENTFLSENESREWRKKIFYRFSQVEKMAFLVTGHTETDTVEKILTSVLRGTSPGACSNSSLLNYRKTVGSFFSSLNNSISFLINFEKKKNLLFRLVVVPKTFFLGPQVQFKKIIWVLFKPRHKNLFLGTDWKPTSFLGKGKAPNKNWNQKNKVFSTRSKCKKQLVTKNTVFCQKMKYCFPNKKSKLLNGPVHPTFYFFPNCPCTKNSFFGSNTFLGESAIKKKTGKSFSFSTEIISSSFCISNDFSNLKITFLKPLDSISRLTISKFLNLYNIPSVSDITNFSSAFSRNQIRHQLIPFSKLLVNPNLEYLLINFFKLLSDQNKSNEKQVQELEFFFKIMMLHTIDKKHCLEPKPQFLIQSPSQKNYFSNEPMTKNTVFCHHNTIKAHFFSNEKRSLVQQLFFDYKNRNLTFFQITKLDTFY